MCIRDRDQDERRQRRHTSDHAQDDSFRHDYAEVPAQGKAHKAKGDKMCIRDRMAAGYFVIFKWAGSFFMISILAGGGLIASGTILFFLSAASAVMRFLKRCV